MKRKKMQELHTLLLTIGASYAAFSLNTTIGKLIFGIFALWGIYLLGWWLYEIIIYKIKIRNVNINDIVLVDEFICPKCKSKYTKNKICKKDKIWPNYIGTKHTTRHEAEQQTEYWYVRSEEDKIKWTINGVEI